MVSWPTELLTLLGVAVGAFASFMSTRLLDRGRVATRGSSSLGL
jgi:hypothetical protein